MFSKNSKAYSVYLLFRFVFSLAASMATVLSIVYHLEVVQLDAFQLVLVGTVLETSAALTRSTPPVKMETDIATAIHIHFVRLNISFLLVLYSSSF